jgi:hypothetical protein
MITSDPTITGWGDPNALVQFSLDSTPISATATADGTGKWTFTPTGLSDGQHTIIASETDLAGNTGTASLTFTLDTTAPVVTEALKNDTGSSSTDKITNDPTLTGSGDPKASVHFTVDGMAIAATATADSNGNWIFKPTGLTDGAHTIVASEIDAAGNNGTASLTFTLDTTPPVPTITSEVLSQGKVTLTGSTSEANDTVSVYDGSNLLGTVTTDSNDNWKFVTGTVSNTVHVYTASATDLAGNVGQGTNEPYSAAQIRMRLLVDPETISSSAMVGTTHSPVQVAQTHCSVVRVTTLSFLKQLQTQLRLLMTRY